MVPNSISRDREPARVTSFPRSALWAAICLSCVTNGILNAQQASRSHSRYLPTVFLPDQLLWELDLGDHQYTVPLVDNDRLFIGVNDSDLHHPAAKPTGGGVFMCLNPQTGRRYWQLPIPRNMHGTTPPFHFNHWKCGVCSRPAIDGNRLYIVGPRGDILCLDRNGQADGNAGPMVDEKKYMGIPDDDPYQLTADDGDIIWRYDLIDQLGVVPHDVCGSSPAIYGDFVYACTSNGVDDTHNAVPAPDAPSLIALDKRTGKLAGVDGHADRTADVSRTVVVPGGGRICRSAFDSVRRWGRCALRFRTAGIISNIRGSTDFEDCVAIRLLSGRLSHARRPADPLRPVE